MSVWDVDGALLGALTDLGVELERVGVGAYLVTLRGARRPVSPVWLIAGEQAVTVEAFVVHLLEDSAVAAVHRHVLRRNNALRGVHYGTDEVGDLFLTGSLSLADVTPVGVDRLLGELWQLLEDDYPTVLSLAYGDRLALDPALSAKVRADGAGRRPAGTPDWAPHRDARR